MSLLTVMIVPLLDRWARASQQGARRNAMVASTDLTRRRIERDQVDDYLASVVSRPEEVPAVASAR